VEYLIELESRATWLATAVSLWFLVKLWRQGELFGIQQIGFSAWFLAAFAMQLAARSPAVWVAGLAAQTLLAIVAALKDRIGSI
jgi:lipopolysaccharide export LptBFGC system permease protein LptF